MHYKWIVFAATFFSLEASALQIVVDPGHGGNDSGAVIGQISESAITLQLAQFIVEELKKTPEIKVSLTRTSDTYMSLEERSKLGNQKGDLFLSIHANSSVDASARGYEIYFQNQLPPDEEALFAAHRENQGQKSAQAEQPRAVNFLLKNRPHMNTDVKAILEDLASTHRLALSSHFAKELYFKWAGDKYKKSHPIRQAPFFVISNLERPSALVEVGYLTNKKEAQRLSDESYQRQIAKGIANAVISYKDFVDKNPQSGLK